MLSLLAGNLPDKPALVCGEDVLTYASYDERSNRAAGALEAVGVQPDDRVAVISFNSIAAFEAAAAVRQCRAGQPKGAHGGKGGVADALAIIGMFGLSGDEVPLMAGPGYHSAVVVFTMLTAACGATTVIMPGFDPEEALALIDRHGVATTF